MPLNVITELWLPLLVAAVVGAFALLVRKGKALTWRGVIGAVALSAALASLHVMIVGRISWPPPGLTERLLPMILLAGAGGCVAACAVGWLPRAFVAFAAGTMCVAVVLWPMLTTSPVDGRLLAAGIALAAGGLAALSAGSISGLEHRGHPFAAATVLTGLGFAIGAALLGSGSMKLGQFGLGVGAAGLALILILSVAWLIARLRSEGTGIGALTAGIAILAALLVAGNRYGELRSIPALLFALPAPLALIVMECMPRRFRPRTKGILAVLAAALFAGLAAGLAIDLPDEADSALADDYGYGP